MHKVLFELGPLTLYSYGFFIAIAFLTGTLLILRISQKYGIPRDDIFDCLIAVLAGGIAGGRLLFVAVNWQYYIADPLKIFMLTEGGLAIQGAILAGILSCYIMCRIKKMPFLKTLDLIVPYVALGQSIGRIGCFMNGCCYGRVCESGFGVIFPGEDIARVPTQLYSSLGFVLIFALLVALRDRKTFDGYIFSLYCMIYSVFRFLMDFLRGDGLLTFAGMTLSQLISVVIFSAAGLLFLFCRQKALGKLKT